MRKIIFGVIMVSIITTSCEKNPTILERINEQGTKVNIKSTNGKYLSSNWDEFIYADKEVANSWEVFTVYALMDGKYVFKAYTGRYLSADLGSEQEIESNRDTYSLWESFELIEINDSTLAIKAENKKYVTVKPTDLRLYATTDSITTSEQFVFTIIK